MSKNILQALGKIDVALGGQADDASNVIDALDQISERSKELKNSIDNIDASTVQQMEQIATGVETEALKAEGVTLGKQNGIDVESDSPYYHANTKYYLEQAQDVYDQTVTVKNSIPTDYTALSDQVDNLKADLNKKVNFPETGETIEITLNNGYYNSSGGFISSSNYKCAQHSVTEGDKLFITGSGTSSIPAYIFMKNNTVVSYTDTSLEMNNTKIVIPSGVNKIRVNNAGTNKDIMIKKAVIDSDFDITNLVTDVNNLNSTTEQLEDDVSSIQSSTIKYIVASQYANFNNAKAGTIYIVTVTNLIMTSNNVPYNYFTGCILTNGDEDGNKQQLAFGDNGVLYVRVKKNETWTNWLSLEFRRPMQATNGTNLDTSEYKNILIAFDNAGVASNHVPTLGFHGAVFNASGDVYGGQFAVDENGNAYTRGKSDSLWAGWNKLAKNETVSTLVNNYCILSAFDNITCLGDSLTYGSVYYGPGAAFRRAKKPYPTVLATRTGANVVSIARSGITPKVYVTDLLSEVTEKDNHLCIIYLGTNGGLTDTIDIDAAGDDKTTYDKNTHTGSYCYIVKHCLDIGARVLLVKCPSANATTNAVIGKIAEKFNVAVVENELMSIKYRTYLNGSGADGIHMNDFGYAAFADYLIRKVDSLSTEMTVRLFPKPISQT